MSVQRPRATPVFDAPALPRYHGVTMLTVNVPVELHSKSKQLVERFAEAMAAKLRRNEVKHGFADDWARDDWEAKCRADLLAHIDKGDPVDVAIYAAFLYARGWKTSSK